MYVANTAVERKEPLPIEVNRLVPLTVRNLIDFVPDMAADYEVIGIRLGQEKLVREIRAGQQSEQQKMIRILEVWKGTEEASWLALIKALESYTPHLSGVVSGIRSFLWAELEKGEQCVLHSYLQCRFIGWLLIYSMVGNPTHNNAIILY